MKTIINRMEKTQDRQGNDEIFVEVIFDVETLGKIPYGKWIQTPDCHKMSNDDIISFMDNFVDDAIQKKKQESNVLRNIDVTELSEEDASEELIKINEEILALTERKNLLTTKTLERK